MKRGGLVVALFSVLSGSVALAQMQPGMGGQQPGMGGQQPGMGQHIPGVGEPGMGGTGGMPGDNQQQNTTQTGDKHSVAKVDDDTLLRQVHEQLARRNEFNDVRPSVKDGVVTLEGSVPQKTDRKRAKQEAESVPGVRKVKEKLSIRPGGPSASTQPETVGGVTGGTANPETSKNTAGSISGNTSASSGTTAGTASMGQAGASTSSAPSTNPGTTPGSNAGGTSQPAGAVTQNSGGAQGSNPGAPEVGTTMPDNASLQGQIQNAFKNDPNLKNTNVVTTVTDESIELTGNVATGKDRQAAKAIAESYAGHRKIVDHLTVAGQKQ